MARGTRRAREQPVYVWVFGFRLVRLALAAVAWVAVAALLGLALAGAPGVGGEGARDVATAVAAYALGGGLAVVLWRWYRGWWHLGDPTLRALLRLTPKQFEHEVELLLTRMGYAGMTVVGRAGDRGADLLGTDPDGASVVVQCKHYAPGHTVGSPEMVHFLGAMVVHKAQRGMFVTTSTYTQSALVDAREQDVQLVDGAELSRLFDAYELDPSAPAEPAARKSADGATAGADDPAAPAAAR